MTDAGADSPDLVVLLSADGGPCGVASRDSVHGTDTPLHLAFSCYVIDAAGRVLITRRSLAKRTWPGVWTNTFCGHPRPGESMGAAIARHARHELGMTVGDPVCVLPDFRYRAVDASGIVENEICPVFVVRAHGEIAPNPEEVIECRWVEAEALGDTVAVAPWALSPWSVEQVRRLATLAARTLAARTLDAAGWDPSTLDALTLPVRALSGEPVREEVPR